MSAIAASAHPQPSPRPLPALLRLGRWLQMRSFGFTPEQIGVNEGLRAAAAVSLMVVLAYATGDALFSWGAFAAFWTCLADPAGPVPLRLRTMGGFAVAGALTGPVMSCAAWAGPLAAIPALFIVVGLSNMARMFGPAAGQAGMLVSVVAVVAVDQPAPLAAAPRLACMFLAGGALALLICVLLWPIHPFQPARRALKAVFRDLGHMAEALQAGPHAHTGNRWAARTAIERARAQVDKTAAAGHAGPVQRELLAVIGAADEIFAGLIAVEHASGELIALEHASGEPIAEHASGKPIALEHESGERRAMALAALLAPLRTALALAGYEALSPAPGWGGVHPQAAALAELAAGDGLAARVAALWARALDQIATARARALGGPAGTGRSIRRKPERTARRAALRHGLRVTLAVLVAYLITQALAVPYAYWATMAVVVVMQPLAETTWPRMLERVTGSVAGGFGAAALTLVLTQPWELVLFVFPLAALTIALRTVNYTLFTLFLTPLFVLVADLVTSGHGWGLALDRAGCNVLGSVLGALLTLYLWRERGLHPFAAVLAAAVDANMSYAALVCGGASAGDIEAARRRAGLASNEAEEALQRAALTGHTSHFTRLNAAILLAALRRLAGAVAARWLERDQPGPDEAGQARGYAALGARLAAAVRREQELTAQGELYCPTAKDELNAAIADVAAAVGACVAPANRV